MTPREIDALVAEKVMDVHLERRYEAGEEIAPGYRAPVPGIYRIEPLHYSTDIEEAWKVIEAVKEKVKGWWLFEVDEWGCRWIFDDGERPTIAQATGELPMAICLATLKAYDVEIS